MSSNNLIKVGEKGSDVYTAEGVGSALVALNTLLVRGVTRETVQEQMKQVCSLLPGDIWAEPAAVAAYKDLWVLLFQNRDVRGGKGERASSVLMWEYMMEHHLEDALKMLPLMTEYGSWRDLFQMTILLPQITPVVVALAVNQLAKDEAALTENKSLSLLAKWIPREDRQPELAKQIARRLFPEEMRPSSRMKAYRRKISTLNRALKTSEVFMCGDEWASIDPAHVPGRCLQKNMKAFLNEEGTTKKGQRPPRFALRHPNNEDRMECRTHFQQFFEKAKKGEVTVKGANVVYPHEIVKKMVSSMEEIYNQRDGVTLDNSSLSADERNGLLAQWAALVKEARESGGLGRSLAMCDFSGSMQSSGKNGDIPYWVSMAMGLLISEVTTEEFKDTFLTFDSDPKLHRLAKGDLFARIASIGHVGQGLSTDFQKAMDLVLARLKASRCKPGEEPDNLIVITDMNWDQARAFFGEYGPYTDHRYRDVVKTAEWQTHTQMIREAFKRAGEDMWGVPFVPPRIVIWNVASTSTDFHATADTEGVVMVSGWSPSLFKNLLKGEIRNMTPLEMLRIILDDERYQPVRDTLNSE